MHTWLILASLFGVAFTKAVKPDNHTEGFCDYFGIKIRVGEKYQPPGKCRLEVCEEATYKQGQFHQASSSVICPTSFVKINKDRTNLPPKSTVDKSSLPYPRCCKVEYIFPEHHKVKGVESKEASQSSVSSSSGE
ncbi:hypothetical protein GE061_019440 [Apolygus lucorum]|uniref:Single domain-containing protein n=1 Tax=Apolygus lucorum TaxID=248454 RepID=A0A6A4JNE2_APOLU|nr:hypothetical protein GE061_019440 [Apolygus lucorum]